jgi:tetratricopeptide (TPR) repeat protein
MSFNERTDDTGVAPGNESDTPATEEDAKPLARIGASRLAGIAVAVLLVGTPIIFLATRTPGDQKVRAQVGVVQGGSNIAALEELVRVRPTKENRVNLSLAYINGGDAGRAIPLLDAVVAEDPKSVVGWNDLCVAHTLRQDYATALDECNNALTIDPTFQLARNNLNWTSDEKRKTLAAIAAANQSGVAHDANFYLAQGLNELHVGDYDQAIAMWQHVTAIDSRNSLATNDIGIAYMMKKQPWNAIEWFERAIQIDPAFQLAKNNLAWAQQEQAKAGK